MKNDLCTYTYEKYKGELTDFYEILQYYKKQYPDKWIDSELPQPLGGGYLMTVDDWKEHCEEGFFIDYDGYGYILDKNYICLHNSRPSARNRVDPKGKFILWFNR